MYRQTNPLVEPQFKKLPMENSQNLNELLNLSTGLPMPDQNEALDGTGSAKYGQNGYIKAKVNKFDANRQFSNLDVSGSTLPNHAST